MTTSVRVQEEDFCLADEWAALRERVGGKAGAIAAFAGLVRDSASADDTSNDGAVQTLFLEHYPGMTEASMQKVVDQALEQWPLEDVVVVHRVGALAPNDQIVLVLVASTHRAAAFAACEFIMDYLKTKAVFWKKETRGTGAAWLRATADDHQRAQSWTKRESDS